jgi:Tfp pilus assembly protein PilF
MNTSVSYSAVAAMALLLGLSACKTPQPFTPTSTTSPTEGAQPQSATVPELITPPEAVPQPKPHTLSAATKSLVTQANAQLAAGNDALAASTLERALRIEPNNPLLWIEMAKLRQEEGNAAQAENLAKKALAMATGDARAQASAWRVMADAYRARGRNPEAREADARAEALSTSPTSVSSPPIP